MTAEEVADEFRLRDWPSRAPAKTLIERYRLAEEMPGVDDVFWIDEAYSSHKIDDEQYDMLYDAVAASRSGHHWVPTRIRRVVRAAFG